MDLIKVINSNDSWVEAEFALSSRFSMHQGAKSGKLKKLKSVGERVEQCVLKLQVPLKIYE